MKIMSFCSIYLDLHLFFLYIQYVYFPNYRISTPLEILDGKIISHFCLVPMYIQCNRSGAETKTFRSHGGTRKVDGENPF